jgi:hypothetical protein
MSLKDQELKAEKDVVESLWNKVFAIEQEIVLMGGKNFIAPDLVLQVKKSIQEAEEVLRQAILLYPEFCSTCGKRLLSSKCSKCGNMSMPMGVSHAQQFYSPV